VAVVRRPTAWAWETPSLSGRVLELSYGTRLPALAWTSSSVQVAMLDGPDLYVKRAAVTLRSRGAPQPLPSGAQLVAEARRYVGLQYLWAGMSGFGLDCSGFTCLVYQALGVTIPRDAAPQAAAGAKVARTALRAGDLVFFRGSSGQIHHVGMYVGGGRMIHSPATGSPVGVVSLAAEPYAREFAGGRRYVP
jgi:cell wall-associated NlpC family hydrolase